MSGTPEDDLPISAATSQIIEVLDERLSVGKRAVKTGSVRVSTRTESREEVAEARLNRTRVEVTRVAVGRVVDAAPPVRTENGVTIVPVMEERVVVQKHLVLVEELHLREVHEEETVRAPVTLRRQHATVEYLGADGQHRPDVIPSTD